MSEIKTTIIYPKYEINYCNQTIVIRKHLLYNGRVGPEFPLTIKGNSLYISGNRAYRNIENVETFCTSEKLKGNEKGIEYRNKFESLFFAVFSGLNTFTKTIYVYVEGDLDLNFSLTK